MKEFRGEVIQRNRKENVEAKVKFFDEGDESLGFEMSACRQPLVNVTNWREIYEREEELQFELEEEASKGKPKKTSLKQVKLARQKQR